MEYERLLIGFGFWDEDDNNKFPRFMMVAEEAEGEEALEDVSAGDVSGKHLAASAQRVTFRIDALEEKMQLASSQKVTHADDRIDALEKKVGAMDSKLDALSTKLLEAIAGVRAPT